jgi:hypothetical protein
MKTQKRFSILYYLIVLFAFGLLFSCEQLAPVEEPVAALEEFEDLSGLTIEREDDPINGRLCFTGNCETDCIEPGSGKYFAMKDSKSKSSGINTKQVSYKAYNTENKFVVKVKYEVKSGPSKAKACILIQINGKKREFKTVPSGYTATFSIPLEKGWKKCDAVTFSILEKGLGSPISFSEEYNLIPVCKDEKALILWNKLGSIEEVTNSEVGPNGKVIGPIDFGLVKFGNGVIPKEGNFESGVDFPSSIFNPESGTIEFWMKAFFLPEPYEFGVYGFINNTYFESARQPLHWFWHNPTSNTVWFKFGLSDGVKVEISDFNPEINKPVHMALVWDRNGIEGTEETIRMYINGSVKATSKSKNWGTDNGGESRIANGWDWDYSENRFAMDNFKVFNFAKTDFSDRDIEGH